MAIKYLDAKRIRGSSTAPATPTWTADLDMSSPYDNGWTAQSSGVIGLDAANNDISFTAIMDNSNDKLDYDLQHADALGSSNNAHDTNWVLKFKLTIDTYTRTDGAGNGLFIGLGSANSTVATAAQQDFIGIVIWNSTGSQDQKVAATWANNENQATNGTDIDTSTASGDIYYVTIIRSSDTAFSVRLTSDSDYTGTTNGGYQEITNVDASGVTNLRYFKVNNYEGVNPNHIIGRIEDVKFYNGITDTATDEKAALVTAAVPASTGWTGSGGGAMASGWTLTSGTGMILDVASSVTDFAVYDLGTSGQMTPNDSWVCDYTVTRNSGDYHDHPMILLRSTSETYNDPSSSGENQITLLYWGNGNTGDTTGSNSHIVAFRSGSTNYEANASQASYCQNVGDTLYYRLYMTPPSGEGSRYVRSSVWDSDANRTAEGSTGRVVNEVSASAANSGWSSSDPLRYFILLNKNGHQANWTISDFKFWNGVASTGVAGNMASRTPTLAFNFTDVPVSSDLPANTLFEETDTRNMYFLQSNVWKRTPITPTDISDLYAWYDATDETTITKSSDRVSKWENKEGTTSRDLVMSGDNRPLWLSADRNGKDVIDFSTVGDDANLSDRRFMKTSSMQSDVDQPISFVMVVEMARNDSTSRDLLQGWQNGSYFPIFNKNSAADSFHSSMGTSLSFTETGIADTWQYMTLIFNTTASKIRIGGDEKASGNVGTSVAKGLRVGVSWNNDACWSAKIMHIVYYSKLLSASEIEGIESWAALQGGL